jgi:hypothetical protein
MTKGNPTIGSPKQRKGLGKTDTTVYGISSDAMNFTFMKLDNESQVGVLHQID